MGATKNIIINRQRINLKIGSYYRIIYKNSNKFKDGYFKLSYIEDYLKSTTYLKAECDVKVYYDYHSDYHTKKIVEMGTHREYYNGAVAKISDIAEISEISEVTISDFSNDIISTLNSAIRRKKIKNTLLYGK